MTQKGPGELGRLAQAPTLTIGQLMLESYIRSGWILLDVFLATGIVAMSVRTPAPGNPHPDIASFYSTVEPFFLGSTVLGTVVLVRRSMNAKMVPILARLPSRAALPAGVALAAGLIRLPLIVWMVGLGILTHYIVHPALGPLLAGGLALLGSAVMLSSLTVTLSAPIATRRIVIVFLVWLTVLLLPDYQMPGLPAAGHALFAVLRLPLWPLASTFNAAASASLTAGTFIALALECCYLLLLAWVGARFLERRDLLFS